MSGASTPLGGLREAVLGAAAELAAGNGARARRDHAGAPTAGGLRRLLDQRRAAAGAGARGLPRARSPQRLGSELRRRLGDDLERFEVAGPGFLNLFLDDRWHRRALAGTLRAGERFGGAGAPVPERILIEFVSANPTGPMHVGHARNAAYGDALARLLALPRPRRSTREFYVNDAGSQVRKLGESIGALAGARRSPRTATAATTSSRSRRRRDGRSPAARGTPPSSGRPR